MTNNSNNTENMVNQQNLTQNRANKPGVRHSIVHSKAHRLPRWLPAALKNQKPQRSIQTLHNHTFERHKTTQGVKASLAICAQRGTPSGPVSVCPQVAECATSSDASLPIWRGRSTHLFPASSAGIDISFFPTLFPAEHHVLSEFGFDRTGVSIFEWLGLQLRILIAELHTASNRGRHAFHLLS